MSKKRKKNQKIKPEDYEGFEYGPIRVERFGRTIKYSSNWDEGEFEEFLKFVKEERPKLKASIDEDIQKLVSIIEKSNPFELLSTVAFRNSFIDPENYTESTFKGKEIFLEYALGLVMSVKNISLENHATKEDIEVFNDLIEKIIRNVVEYFASESSENQEKLETSKFKFLSLTRYLYHRGDSYPQHHIDLLSELFTSHNTFLKQNIDFEITQIISAVDEIEHQISSNIEKFHEFKTKLSELHNQFKDFVDKEDITKYQSLEDFKQKYLSLPEVNTGTKELENLHDQISKIPFELTPNEHISIEFLEMLSSTFGENQSFITFQKTPGWPTNNSIVYSKPILKYENKYYCFSFNLVHRNLKIILENWIQENDPAYYDNNYQKNRGDFLENKSFEYLTKLLPNSKIYKKLYYNVIEEGLQKRVETDGLIIFDNNIFIIEAKAGSLSLVSRRGGLQSLKTEISRILDDAYKQALRTKKFIKETDIPKFNYEDGTDAIVLSDKDKYKNIFLVNVTLENLGILATNLNSIKKWNLIQGKEWPWSVFLNDLRVISEIIEFPTEFLLFLQRRIRTNDYPQFEAIDELDFLMMYLQEGLYFEDIDFSEHHNITPTGYTEDLDRYYEYIAGRVSTGVKPKTNVNDEFKKLIKQIELQNRFGFSQITTLLLGCSGQIQNDLLQRIDKLIDLDKKDSKDHNCTLLFDDFGLTICVTRNKDFHFWQKIEQYCSLKLYQTRFGYWVVLVLNTKNPEKIEYDFNEYKKEWKFEHEMESTLKEFKSNRVKSILKVKGKIGRNEPCPCGSGLKYKKCCLKQ